MFPFISLSRAKRLFDAYMRKALRNGAGTIDAKDPQAQDEEMWRSDEDGRHFRFESESGEITAGFGGKLNGVRLRHKPQGQGKQHQRPGGGSSSKGEQRAKEKTKEEKTGKSRLFEYGDSTGLNDFSKATFTKQGMKDHERHIREMGFKDEREYVASARKFGSQPVGGDICGGRDRNGQIIRYDRKTCVLFIGNPRVNRIVTYFKVKDGKPDLAKKYMKSHFPGIEIK